jgi:hypothetical protein
MSTNSKETVTDKETSSTSPVKEGNWMSTLLAPGVTKVQSKEFLGYEYEINMDVFTGDKIELIQQQAKRALEVLDKVAQKEFPNMPYYSNTEFAVDSRQIRISGDFPFRESVLHFMDNKHNYIYVLTDAELEQRARHALNEILLGD